MDELRITGIASGLTTLSAYLYAAGALAATIALPEGPASSGNYANTGTLSLAAGTYAVAIKDGGNNYGNGIFRWNGTAEILPGTNAGDSPNAAAAQGTIATNLNATVSSRATPGAQMDLINTPNPTALIALAAASLGMGTGPVAVSSNTGGTGQMSYLNGQGVGIGGATVMLYLASDWPINPANLKAAGTTNEDGSWGPLFVNHGTYTAVFVKVGFSGPDASGTFTV